MLEKVIRRGEKIPAGYGIAHTERDSFDLMYGIAYPIPLNLIIGLLRRLYFWAMYGHKLYEDGFYKGYRQGAEKGRKYAFNQFKQQALKREIANIIKNFIEEEDKMRRKDEKSIDGWINKFIEKETKRICLNP